MVSRSLRPRHSNIFGITRLEKCSIPLVLSQAGYNGRKKYVQIISDNSMNIFVSFPSVLFYFRYNIEMINLNFQSECKVFYKTHLFPLQTL